MVERVRHQLFLPKPVSDRLDRRGTSELEERFALRLARMSSALARIERDGQVVLETLALFIRFELAIQSPLAENDHAGRALARERFEAFVTQVGRAVASGRRTLSPMEDER
jgi:hypothetical protein